MGHPASGGASQSNQQRVQHACAAQTHRLYRYVARSLARAHTHENSNSRSHSNCRSGRPARTRSLARSHTRSLGLPLGPAAQAGTTTGAAATAAVATGRPHNHCSCTTDTSIGSRFLLQCWAAVYRPSSSFLSCLVLLSAAFERQSRVIVALFAPWRRSHTSSLARTPIATSSSQPASQRPLRVAQSPRLSVAPHARINCEPRLCERVCASRRRQPPPPS